MRLFAAIELPDVVKAMLLDLECELPGMRWVLPDQLHLTLAFIGEVDGQLARRIELQLASVDLRQFELKVSGAGCFPGGVRARVLWVGFEQNDALMRLAAQVAACLKGCGVALEERGFRPHVTLARLKQPAPEKVAAFLRTFEGVALPPFSVNSFILFESRLQPSGAIHFPVRTYSAKELI